MKKLILLISLGLISLASWGQSMPKNTNGKIEYTEVIEIPNTSQKELYNRAKKWFVKTYKSPKDVIQVDTEDGISGFGALEILIKNAIAGSTINGKYSIQVDFKDNKFRYSFTNIYYLLSGAEFTTEKIQEFADKRTAKGKEPMNEHKQYIEQTNQYFKDLATSLKKYLIENPKDDW
jgi:hypothetical protein